MKASETMFIWTDFGDGVVFKSGEQKR